MPKFKVYISAVYHPQYGDHTVIVDAKNSDEAEAKARVIVRDSNDDIDYINEVRSIELNVD